MDSTNIVITVRNAKNPNGERIPVGKISKTNATCYACGVAGHYAVECPTKTKALALVEPTSEAPEFIYEATDESEPEGFPSDMEDDRNLMVMRCILTTPRASDDCDMNLLGFERREGDLRGNKREEDG